MLAIALTLALFAQDPTASWVGARPLAATVSEACAVRGDAELSPAAALASARQRAEQQFRERWTERAERIVSRQRPIWLPGQLLRLDADRWLAALPIERSLCVVDREDRQRDHEFGQSYQTTLWVLEDDAFVARSERQLRQHLDRATRRIVFKSGGTVLFWAALALLLGWVDRLSRGYMTGRLRLVGLLLGSAVPVTAFLL